MKKIIVVLVILTLALAGCMKKEEEPAAKETIGNKIVVEDIYGKQEFDKPFTRVAALEWNIVEELLAVGVQPAAVADIEGFNTWVTIDKKLADGIVDVGQRNEPNIEEIAKAKPDLIIGLKNHEPIKAELEKIAPVVLFDHASEEATKDLYQAMIVSLENTGKLVGKEQEAKEAIAHLEAQMAEAKTALAQANLATKEFLFTQAFTVNEAPTFRLFTPNSTVSHVLEGMGLTNRMQDQTPQPWGMLETNVEGVAKYQEAMLLHTVQKEDPLFKNLANNKAWNNFAFVKNNEMYDLGGGVWTFGSVLSAETLIKNVVTTMTK
ncbi:ferrichrome ABC transporter substrate-binding protein [Lysinibacillus alkalisoli]|uniref:Ferrichrome ABC transporter substrate-binding protein n=1 Tax=Lysinibacillus alkalisoli TaxID=1911548 RepID=A0A917FZP0_9BACI|nr:iron-siderophore ABC transporter substrate-binding protein [Lysinibacillus alkalisoli]GGG15496.1 ferrichrome ABC transporter substrate-binding protein [Lysinibacillus alkalisoli]